MSSAKTVSDILFGFVSKVALRFRGILMISLITIHLGVSAYGAYAQIFTIANLVYTVADLGLHQALIRYGQRTDDTADLYYSILSVVLLAGGLVAAAIFAAAPVLSEFTLQSDEYVDTYRVGAALVISLATFRVAKNYFRMDSRIRAFSIIETVDGYGTAGAAGVVLILFDADLAQVFVAIVLVQLAVTVLLHGQIVREIGVTLPTFRNLKTCFEYSLPVALSLFVGSLSSRADRVMIGFFLGATAVGVYSIAYEISLGIIMYVSAIRQTFFPEFSKFLDNDQYEKCGTYVSTGVRYFLVLALPTAGGMYLIGPEVIGLLTEGRGLPSPGLISIIALGITAQGVDVIYGVVMRAAEETYLRAKFVSTGAVGNILINAVTIPLFGVMGAAAATLLTYLFISGLTIGRVRKIVPVELPWLTVLRCLGATIAMVALSELVLEASVIVTVIVSVPTYFGLLFVLRELTIDEVRVRLGV